LPQALRRGADRLRAEGAGRRHELVLAGRVLVTLAVLRLQIPHAALAVMYGVHRSTVTRAVHEIRPLLADRGYATPQGQRLHALADVFAYAAACGITPRIDGSEIQVRRPRRAGPDGGRSSPARRK
jgi:Helix-turn-helix of DDE superfamily endonuclease